MAVSRRRYRSRSDSTVDKLFVIQRIREKWLFLLLAEKLAPAEHWSVVYASSIESQLELAPTKLENESNQQKGEHHRCWSIFVAILPEQTFCPAKARQGNFL
jgi:hypothetical protein